MSTPHSFDAAVIAPGMPWYVMAELNLTVPYPSSLMAVSRGIETSVTCFAGASMRARMFVSERAPMLGLSMRSSDPSSKT